MRQRRILGNSTGTVELKLNVRGLPQLYMQNPQPEHATQLEFPEIRFPFSVGYG